MHAKRTLLLRSSIFLKTLKTVCLKAQRCKDIICPVKSMYWQVLKLATAYKMDISEKKKMLGAHSRTKQNLYFGIT